MIGSAAMPFAPLGVVGVSGFFLAALRLRIKPECDRQGAPHAVDLPDHYQLGLKRGIGGGFEQVPSLLVSVLEIGQVMAQSVNVLADAFRGARHAPKLSERC